MEPIFSNLALNLSIEKKMKKNILLVLKTVDEGEGQHSFRMNNDYFTHSDHIDSV